MSLQLNRPSNLIFAIDFDGTLYQQGKTEFPTVDVKYLNMDLIKSIEQCQKLRPNDQYILWTCREGLEVDLAVEAIKKVSTIRWDAINDNVDQIKQTFGNCRKVIADFYIDDRSASPEEGKYLFHRFIKEATAHE